VPLAGESDLMTDQLPSSCQSLHMAEQPIGTAFQFALTGTDLPDLLRRVAGSIEGLGEDAEVLDVTVRTTTSEAGVYFVRR
jgi:hypothetical protein